MIFNNNKNNSKRIFSAILIYLSILLVSKEFIAEINNKKEIEINNNSTIVYLDDKKIVVDGKIVEVGELPGYKYVGHGMYVKNNIAPYGYEFSGNNTCTKIMPVDLPDGSVYLNGNIITNVFNVVPDGFILENNDTAIRLNEKNTEELLNKYPEINLENKTIDLTLCNDYSDIIFLKNNEVVIKGIYFTVMEKDGYEYMGCGIFYDRDEDCFVYGYQINTKVVENKSQEQSRIRTK